VGGSVFNREKWITFRPRLTDIAWQNHREQEKPVLVSVELPMRPDASENDTRQLPAFVTEEFQLLLPLYRFCSWDPEKNSFLQR